MPPVEMQPVQPSEPTSIPMAPSTDYSPGERQYHESWWKKVLDNVGTILGGDQTYKITKSPDGTMTASYEPSTTGEKWGRVAMAALGGAAQGAANSQGPGGLARGAAAGTQFGLKQPQQIREDVDQQVLHRAQMVKLNQDNVINAWNYKNLPQKYADEQAERALKHAQTLDEMGATPIAMNVNDPKELAQRGIADPSKITAHMEGNVFVEPNGKGGANFWQIPGTAGNQRTTSPTPWFSLSLDPDDKTKTVKTEHIAPAGEKYSDYFKRTMGLQSENDRVTSEAFRNEQAQKRANKPTNPTEASLAVTASSDPDPAKRAEAKNALDLLNRKKTGAAGEAGAAGQTGENVANIRNAGGNIAQALSAVPPSDQGIVKGIGEGRSAPYSRGTKEGQRIMALVNSVYPDYDSSRFPAYQATRTKFTSGAEGQGLAFIKTARNHLARMETNIPDNVSIPYGIGSMINWAKNSGNKSTDPRLKAFADDVEAVSSEVARAYKGGVIGVEDHKRMQELLSMSDSPAAIKGAIQEFRELLKGKLQSYREQWDSGMPSGVVSPLSTLENLERETGAPSPTPTPGPTPAPATNPAGGIAWPKTPAPQGHVWVAIPGQPVGHIPSANVEGFKAKHPDAQVQP